MKCYSIKCFFLNSIKYIGGLYKFFQVIHDIHYQVISLYSSFNYHKQSLNNFNRIYELLQHKILLKKKLQHKLHRWLTQILLGNSRYLLLGNYFVCTEQVSTKFMNCDNIKYFLKKSPPKIHRSQLTRILFFWFCFVIHGM